MTPKTNKFPATVIIVIIFAGAIFLLSGLCTGLFAWDAEKTGGGAYSPGHWYEALFIGSFALIPSGLMLWAAIRQMGRGNNKVSGIIFLIAGSAISLIFSLSTFSLVAEVYDATLRSSASSGRLLSALTALAYILLLLAAGVWLIRVGIKILRNKGQAPIAPETFD